LFVGYTAAYAYLGDGGFVGFLDGIAGVIGSVLPLVGILLGYKSVSGERSSGSLFLSLSLPHSRGDLVAGKFVGRTVVLLAPTMIALTIAGPVGMFLYGTDGALLYPWFLVATSLYGVAFVGIAIGLSTVTAVERWVTIGALFAYLLLVQLWDNLQTAALLFLHRFDFRVLESMPDWALLFRMAKPSESYYRLVRAGFDGSARAGRYVGDGVPLYVDWWVAGLLLVSWAVVPAAVGYRRFRGADL